MTREDKELLLKDLCARLPYMVKCKFENKAYDILGFDRGRVIICLPFMSNTIATPIENIKLYLFPLSNVNEEQMEELMANGLFKYRDTLANVSHLISNGKITEEVYTYIDIEGITYLIEFFNSHHIDYRGLIEKGLAIDATGLNIY